MSILKFKLSYLVSSIALGYLLFGNIILGVNLPWVSSEIMGNYSNRDDDFVDLIDTDEEKLSSGTWPASDSDEEDIDEESWVILDEEESPKVEKGLSYKIREDYFGPNRKPQTVVTHPEDYDVI